MNKGNIVYKTNSTIKSLDAKMSALVGDGDFESAQEIAIQSKELKASLNDPKNYDLESDWLAFNH